MTSPVYYTPPYVTCSDFDGEHCSSCHDTAEDLEEDMCDLRVEKKGGGTARVEHSQACCSFRTVTRAELAAVYWKKK